MLTEREALIEALSFIWQAHVARKPKHPEREQCPSCKMVPVSYSVLPGVDVSKTPFATESVDVWPVAHGIC